MKQKALRYTGMKIKPILDAQGRRQDWLARRVGVSPALINRAIKGDRTLSRPVAERIAAALDVPFFVLFDSPIGSTSIPNGNAVEVAA